MTTDQATQKAQELFGVNAYAYLAPGQPCCWVGIGDMNGDYPTDWLGSGRTWNEVFENAQKEWRDRHDEMERWKLEQLEMEF